MNIDGFLSRLEKVKRTGKAFRWMACCPAHDDKRPSLSVSLTNDGRILAHCYSGCSISEVVGAVGLTILDLMPETRPEGVYKRERFPAMDVLKALQFHATVVAVAAIDAANGKTFSAEDKDTLLASAAAIHEAYGMVA